MMKTKAEKILDAIAKAKKLSEEGIRLASMYFACQNLGLDRLLGKRPTTPDEIRRGYRMADQACAEGTGDTEGPGAEPERKSFEKDLRSKAKQGCWLAQLAKEVSFIFEVP